MLSSHNDISEPLAMVKNTAVFDAGSMIINHYQWDHRLYMGQSSQVKMGALSTVGYKSKSNRNSSRQQRQQHRDNIFWIPASTTTCSSATAAFATEMQRQILSDRCQQRGQSLADLPMNPW